ncbi:MAG: hypothetical protein CL930_06730 [Deltaproteobacteria bacterium]|nr:hypothetical protein [Deltaproteobacteria bacterium]
MGPLMKQAIEFFQKDEWDVQSLSDTVLQTAFKGDNGEWDCLAVILEESNHFLFYSVLNLKVPDDLHPPMGLFLHRANHGLNVGNFEFDINEGEVRFKTSIQVSAENFNHSMFQSLVHHNVLVVDEYYPGISNIISQNMSAEAAIMMIETPAVGDA